ncbi:alpha/beta fold hydrolase [Solimonas sp. SE-A11]|uniref:alpha/beta fold hydrolase n=1 Tax=Solimonas sp. SE-A11 TaxID=3054954 RepID=UPI00259CA5DE|nr:alpha/beta hydrolase [Solimonas sp. SE-A11]MDM4773045.1 alpha/beta hydrolase [Solimonas sp. SE-A11]
MLVLGLLVASLALFSWGQGLWIEHRYPPVGKFIEVDGLRLHYVEQGRGAGPALLFVHGASSNLREFTANLMPALSGTHRVIAFDRPGYGYSERGRGPWMNPSEIASLLLTACRRLGIERPVIVGHSWAGSVVLAAMVEMPEKISGGILVAGVAGHWVGSPGWTYDVASLPVIGALFSWTVVTPVGQFLLEQEIAPVLAPQPVPMNHVEKVGALLALRPQTFRHNVQDMSALNEYLQELSSRYDRIERPLQIIHGEEDALVPFWNHGRRLTPVVHRAEVTLIPQAGHALHHTHVSEVSTAIGRFVRSIPEDQSAPSTP